MLEPSPIFQLPSALPPPPPPIPEALRAIEKRLELEEVDPEFVSGVLSAIRRDLPEARQDDEREVFATAAQEIMRWTQVTGPLKLKSGGLTVVALVGPTGVGKSTTLAKLAAISAHKDQNSVGLITTDTFRIAAVEQIKVYARLLGLPLSVVRTREEMQEALKAFAQCDVVFVDTAGQSPNEQQRLLELEEILGVEAQIRRLLVMSATTKHSDVRNILQRFEALRYDGIIITKLDESRSHGLLLNASSWSGRPITYLGVGQGVPQDLELATRERITDLILDLSGRFPNRG